VVITKKDGTLASTITGLSPSDGCACSMATLGCMCARWRTSWRRSRGLRLTTEDAVLNANYIRKKLEGIYDLPYSTPTMHEVVFSDRLQTPKGVKTGDIAKRLIDYGFHPYT